MLFTLTASQYCFSASSTKLYAVQFITTSGLYCDKTWFNLSKFVISHSNLDNPTTSFFDFLKSLKTLFQVAHFYLRLNISKLKHPLIWDLKHTILFYYNFLLIGFLYIPLKYSLIFRFFLFLLLWIALNLKHSLALSF